MALLGRCLTGLGGCRGINRRYIADAASVENRTMISAAFVAMGGIGMSLGPGLGVLLARFKLKLFLPFLGTQVTLNVFTGPAYAMAASWLLYCVLVLTSFREPKRPYTSTPASTRKTPLYKRGMRAYKSYGSVADAASNDLPSVGKFQCNVAATLLLPFQRNATIFPLQLSFLNPHPRTSSFALLRTSLRSTSQLKVTCCLSSPPAFQASPHLCCFPSPSSS